MKKVLVTILALIYLVTSTGAAVTVHYCMGKVASLSLAYNKDKACGKCGMKTKTSCCTDEFKSLKINDSHEQAAVYQSIVPLKAIVDNNEILPAPGIVQEVSNITTPNHSPPRSTSRHLFILNCVFLI